MQGITPFKKRDDNEVFGGWYGFHKTKVEREHGQSDENMLTKSHDVVYCFHIKYNSDLAWYKRYFAEINGRSKNCPNEWLF